MYQHGYIKQDINSYDRSNSGITRQLVISTIIPLIGSSVPMGYGIGVMNSPQSVIRSWIQEGLFKNYDITLTSHQNIMLWSSVISIFLVGSTFGGLKGGALADKIVRRKAFMFNHLLCLFSCLIFILCKFYQAPELLLISQLLLGTSAGISSCLVPVYLSEIEPKSFQGMAVIHAFGISLGTFISQICGMSTVLGSADSWPFLACVPLSCALLALMLHPYLQESPCFETADKKDKFHRQPLINNINKKKRNETKPLLSTVFVDIDQKDPVKYNFSRLLKDRSLHKPILLTFLLYIITVFSGLYAIVAFGNIVFTSAGLNQQQSEIASICATGLQCIMGIISIFLNKKCRRKPRLLTSFGGCIVSLVMLMLFLGSEGSVASYMAIISCALYFIFYAIGIGALPDTISVELLPEEPRPLVISLATGLFWISNILVGTSFPLVQSSIGEYSIIFFILSCICSALIFYFYLPETFTNDAETENRNLTENNNVTNVTDNNQKNKSSFNQRIYGSYIEI